MITQQLVRPRESLTLMTAMNCDGRFDLKFLLDSREILKMGLTFICTHSVNKTMHVFNVMSCSFNF